MAGLGRDGWPVRMALGLGLLGLLAVPGTRASWTDPAPVDGTRFSTATVDLKVESSDVVTDYSALNVSAMEPGDSTAAVLTVTNSGTAAVSYYVDATATGIGSQLTAKVTTDTATSGSTCPGTAVPGSGTTFSANLVSASNPLQLAGGASEKLCVQGKLPDGGVARGGSGTLGFTFKAMTGSTATPGWADSVAVSGTSLTAAFAYYLGGNTGSSTTSPSGDLSLRLAGPTLTTLPNYDTDRDTEQGLLLKNNAAPSGRSQTWVYPVGSAGLTLTGTSNLRFWSAAPGFGSVPSGSLQVALLDCTPTCGGGALATATVSGSWSGPWSARTVAITTASSTYTWVAGHSLGVKITNTGNSDLMVAYDTTAYRAALLIR